ncbi:MAG: Hsp20/alpha crystallin family protein [Halioglobus sp.]|nr:Hsp20/alpha crystallin family protein [Halioglobus sp.]
MMLVPRSNVFDFDRFFNSAWSQPAESRANAFFAPRVDINDQGDHYEISAELPGVDKKDIHVHVKDGVLTLEAEAVKEDKEEKDGRLIRQERRYGKFRRSFNLGENVQESDIKAKFNDGVLTLEAPKAVEKEKERRRIDVH